MDDLTLAGFAEFEQKDWVEWLDKTLARMPVNPTLRIRDDDLIEALLRMYRHLQDGASRFYFGKAVIELLEATPLLPKSAERLSHLIELVDYAKPIGGKPVLERLLRSDVGWKLAYGNTVLQYILLNAASAYGCDERLKKYVVESVKPGVSFEYLVLCFRVLTLSMDAHLSFYFLEHLIPHLDSSTREHFLLRGLKGSVRKLGCTELLLFVSDRVWQLRHHYPEQTERFNDTVQKSVALQITEAEILELVAQANVHIRSEIVDTLRRLHQYVSPDLQGASVWDFMDHDVEPGGRSGTWKLYTKRGVTLLYKGKDGNALRVLEEARESALTAEGVPNFEINIAQQEDKLKAIVS